MKGGRKNCNYDVFLISPKINSARMQGDLSKEVGFCPKSLIRCHTIANGSRLERCDGSRGAVPHRGHMFPASALSASPVVFSAWSERARINIATLTGDKAENLRSQAFVSDSSVVRPGYR